MNKQLNPKKHKVQKEPDLEIDEDIELALEYEINDETNDKMNAGGKRRDRDSTNPSSGKTSRKTVPISSKAKLAGILLLISFILSLIFPITFIIAVNEIETATGETTLKGKILDENEKPLENVNINIKKINQTTQTDSEGKYFFKNIPVGEYEIEYSKSGYRKILVTKILFSKGFLSQNDETDNTINIPGTLSSGIYIDAIEGPFIESTIIDDNLNQTIYGNVKNKSGIILNNVDLDILGTNLSSKTDENGDFIFNGVPPGIIEIKVTLLDNKNSTTIKFLFSTKNSYQFNITFDETKNSIIDEITNKFGRVNGTIFDSKAWPLNNLEVELNPINNLEKEDEPKDPLPTRRTKTKNDGTFLIDNVSVGFYRITIKSEDYFLTYINNITIKNSSNVMLPDLVIKKLKEPVVVEEEISSPYTYACIIILILFSILTLVGAISSFQQKRYTLAFIGAVTGILPILLALQLNICGASVLSLTALVLIIFSRDEFDKNLNKPLR